MKSKRFPDFILIGAQKSGTTFLDRLLREHPDVFMPRHLKEAHYFDNFFDRGDEWYASLFKDADGKICGESTPNYIAHPDAPKRMYELLPDARLIVVLRNPIERTISNYRKAVTRFGFDTTFRKFAEENESIITLSRYHEQLVRYLKYFSRDQIHIVVFEDLISCPVTEMSEVYRFIGVDHKYRPTSGNTAANQTRNPRFKLIWSFVRPITRWLYNHNLSIVHHCLTSLGLKRFFFSNKPLKNDCLRPTAEDIEWVRDRVADDVELLSKLTGRDMLGFWKL